MKIPQKNLKYLVLPIQQNTIDKTVRTYISGRERCRARAIEASTNPGEIAWDIQNDRGGLPGTRENRARAGECDRWDSLKPVDVLGAIGERRFDVDDANEIRDVHGQGEAMPGMAESVVGAQWLSGDGDRVGGVFKKNDAGKAHRGIYVLPTPGYSSPMLIEKRPVHVVTALTEVIQRLGIPKDLQHGPWIAGGAARAVYQGNTGRRSGDIDVFLGSNGNAKQVINRIKRDFVVADNSTNKQGTVTLLCQIDIFGVQARAKIQVIPGWHAKDLEGLFASFDFTVCQFATNGIEVAYTREAAEDLKVKRLRLTPEWTKPTRPTRIVKYLNQGFTPEAPTLRNLYALGTRKMYPNLQFKNDY
jgi:hypothetical protein